MFNGSNVQNPDGFFTFNEAKHNFNTKFQGSYDGLTFNSGLKLEGATLVAFTTNAIGTVTIVQSTWSNFTLKLDGNELDVATATTPAGSDGVRVYTEAISAGEHKITRGNGESGIFYVIVKTEGDATGITTVRARTQTGATYNLGGQRVAAGYKGIVVKNGHKQVVR